MNHWLLNYSVDWGMRSHFPICSVWIILFAPLVAAVLITLVTHKWKGLSAALSIVAIVLSFALSMGLFLVFTVKHIAHQPHTIQWLAIGDAVRIEFGMITDPLAMLMLLVVTGVGSAIHVYSLGYMKGDPGFSRYFACLSLFTFSMLGIVLSNNFIQIFIFWELVGASSYLLIGFWFEKPSAAEAGKKAFLTTRIGDVGMMLGILLLWSHAGTFNFAELQAKLPIAGVVDGNAGADWRVDLYRCSRQKRAGAFACLVARRDGRPDSSVGIDSCRDDGGRGRVYALPRVVADFAEPNGAGVDRVDRRHHRHHGGDDRHRAE